MLHVDPDANLFEATLPLSQLRYVISSRAAATTLAENYTGYLPLSWLPQTQLTGSRYPSPR
jgi:p-hydroxybenzoate 3-monooxygenase